MAYCTVEELIDSRINRGFLATWEAQEPGVTAAAIDSAAALMDSYFAARYPTPVTSTGAAAALRVCNAALARYELLQRRGLVTPDVQADRDYYIQGWLSQIATGKLPLAQSQDSSGIAAPTGDIITVRRNISDPAAPHGLFGPCILERF